MELVSIESVGDIEIGDVVVVNWPGEAITANVVDIQRSRDGELEGESIKFICGPTTHVMTFKERLVMTNYDAEEFIYPFDTDPTSAYIIR